ncbi:alpha-tocopherol transfer protein-like [Zophobas morio]|uniref:alpha-tocopherol transfer protein-like n=1 Tax=Zophobas morio TaxID=2755281 RepID=UPI003083798F
MFLVQPTLEQQTLFRNALDENSHNIQSEIEILKKWLKEQPHLPDTWDEHCLLHFLKGCKFSVETSKKKLENYFIFRATLPEFFSNRDVRNPEIKEVLKVMQSAVLPELTPDGKRISIARAVKYDFETPNIADMIKLTFMVGDLRLKLEETGVFDVYIADFNFPLAKHFYKINPLVLKKMFMCVQEAYPVLIKEVHLVNAPPFIEFVMTIVKPFLSPALSEVIHVHTSIETLYDFIPKNILPEEYGGNAGKMSDLQDKWLRTLEEHSSWFEKEDNIKADLSIKTLKNGSRGDCRELEGSFRKLCVD